MRSSFVTRCRHGSSLPLMRFGGAPGSFKDTAHAIADFWQPGPHLDDEWTPVQRHSARGPRTASGKATSSSAPLGGHHEEEEDAWFDFKSTDEYCGSTGKAASRIRVPEAAIGRCSAHRRLKPRRDRTAGRPAVAAVRSIEAAKALVKLRLPECPKEEKDQCGRRSTGSGSAGGAVRVVPVGFAFTPGGWRDGGTRRQGEPRRDAAQERKGD